MRMLNRLKPLRGSTMVASGRGLAAVLLVAFALAAGPVLAGGFDHAESPHSFQLYMPFNKRDLALGAEYSFRSPSVPWLGAFANIAARPYHMTAYEQLRPHFRLVYREVRYHGGVGLQTATPVGGPVFVCVGLGAAFTFGDYAGTRRSPESGWTPLLRGGLLYAPAASPFLAQVGYQYADLKSAGSNWAFLCAGMRF